MTYRLPRINNPINNQNGSLVIIALLIMVTLAITGLLMTNDAVMESRVGRNYVIYNQTVMAAESAAKELMQAIDSTFETAPTSLAALEAFSQPAITWAPHDGYNEFFEFDQDIDFTISYNYKPSLFKNGDPNDLAHFTDIGSFAVLVDQTTSVLTPGLSGTKMREHFEYNVYCMAEHAGAPNGDVTLVIGYRQEKM